MSTYRHVFSSLAAVARRPVGPSPAFRVASVAVRNVHQLRQLPYNIENGLGEFLSPEALRVIAVDYQSGLLQRLNAEVRETELEGLSVAQTVISATKQQILAFNYASQALNNSFFLDNLKPPIPDYPNHEKEIIPELMSLIYESFDDLEGLKSYMSAAALGMTGSGWVWLVVDMSIKSLAVVATYGPGTMLVRSRQHRHPNGINEIDLLPRAFFVLGEQEATAKSASTKHTIGGVGPPPTSPTSGVAHRAPYARPRSNYRTFSTSLPPYHPLNLTHRLSVQPSPSLSNIQFSQTPLAWHQPLEPLSKKNSSTSTSAGDLLTPSSQYTPGAGTDEEVDFDDPEAPPIPRWTLTSNDLIGGGTNSNKQLGTTKLLRSAGDDLSPLMCLSVHEHAWMSAGLGVWGKEEYLKRFWSVVDWRKVGEVYRLWETRDAVFRNEGER